MLNVPDAIKTLYQSDSIRKNFRVHFPNGEMDDITNANVLTESVTFTESLCSQQYLKFGLTEASEIQFETIGIGNMMGMTIQCYSEIDTSSLTAAQISEIQAMSDLDGELVLEANSDLTDYYGNPWGFYRVPLGTFIVDECPRNHGAMTHRKITAYTVRYNGSEPFSDYGHWYIEKLSYPVDKMKIDQGLFYQTIYDTAGSDMPNIVTVNSEITLHDDHGYVDERDRFGNYDTRPSVTVKDTNDNEVTLYFVTSRKGQRPLGSSSIPGVETDKTDFDSGLYYVSQSNLRENVAAIENAIKAWLTTKGYDFSESGTTLADFARSVALHSTTPVFDSFYSGFVVTTNGNFVMTGETRNESGTTEYYELFNKDNHLIYISPTGSTTQSYLLVLMKELTGITVTIDDGSSSTTESIVSTPMPISSANHLYKVSITDPLFPNFEISVDSTGNIEETYYTYINAIDFAKVLGGALELTAKFGRLDRYGVYQIKMFEDDPVAYEIGRSLYSELWWDEYDISPIGAIEFTYHDKNTGSDETSMYNFGGGTSVYEMNDNYLLKHLENITAQDVREMLDTNFIPNLGSITFTPIDLDMIGLPYLEDGDFLTVIAEDGVTVSSYILRRTIKGIQALQDTIESTNGELMSIEEVYS